MEPGEGWGRVCVCVCVCVCECVYVGEWASLCDCGLLRSFGDHLGILTRS